MRINAVIEAAIVEFIEKGYEKASMESIAKAAKLSKGGLYHHFSSKTDILYAVNLKIVEPIQEIMAKIEKNRSLVNGLKQFVVDYLSYWDSHKRELKLYFCTMNISFGNPQIMTYYSEVAKQEVDIFGAYFVKGQQEGIFKIRDARMHSMAFISCLDGYLGYMLIVPEVKLNKIITEIQSSFITDYLIQK